MRFIMMIIFGILWQAASLLLFDASSAEGFIAFLGGNILGSLAYQEIKKEAE